MHSVRQRFDQERSPNTRAKARRDMAMRTPTPAASGQASGLDSAASSQSIRAAKALRIMIRHAPLPAKTPQPQPLFTKETDNIRVRKAMLLIERHLGDPLPAEFIAQHVNVSVRHLERLFQSELGMSPQAFAFELRLNNAFNLLITTRNSIIDVALQCGFLSNSHFSRCFRNMYGKTPSQVRDEAVRKTGAGALPALSPGVTS